MNPTTKPPKADNARRTPVHIVEAARQVLGVIDLDPASDEQANQTVKATRIFTREDDGLTIEWLGRVFLNPPGGHVQLTDTKSRQSRSAIWWSKLHDSYAGGLVHSAIFIAYNLEAFLNTQRWGLPCQAYPFCVPEKRLVFPSSGGGNAESPPGASAIVYLGLEISLFQEVFSDIGYVRV